MSKNVEIIQRQNLDSAVGITKISVSGYKSISDEQSIDIKPLTILAGANSSGKSSMMQPILLMKQTLDADFDPGALLLNGPNVKFTSIGQLLSRVDRGKSTEGMFNAGIDCGDFDKFTVRFINKPGKGLEIKEMTVNNSLGEIIFNEQMTNDELVSVVKNYHSGFSKITYEPLEVVVIRKKCFLMLDLKHWNGLLLGRISIPHDVIEKQIRELIHIPGLRGNPERTYPVTGVRDAFPGTFEKYTASVIADWQREGKTSELDKLFSGMKKLGLASRVTAKRINDAQVEIQVGRTMSGSAENDDDMVSIADVGFGVSQTLPALVALIAAKPGQMVYLEQPEIHLHPRAQTVMAEILADAAKRGVRVVVETHSSLLLRGIQTLVAKGELPTDIVKLHWFKRNTESGATEIYSTDLDEEGAYGDWPEDFDEVNLKAEMDYLDAQEKRGIANEEE